MLRSLVHAVLALAGCAPLTLALAAEPGVEWVVTSNGLPGTRGGSKPSTQLLTARGQRLRMLDPEGGSVVYLDVEGRRWVEGLPRAQRYRETPFDELEARRSRDQERRARTTAALERRHRRLLDRDDRAGARALEREASEAGLRLDGRPDQVRLEHFPQDRCVAPLIVDGQAREVTLEHYQVRVNQSAQPACELWVTEDLTLPVDLLRFYRAAGVFQPRVVERLAQVPGVVVRAVVHLEQGALRQRLSTEVSRVRTEVPVREADLEPPPQWQRVEPQATAEDTCELCAEALPPGEARLRYQGRVFCSSAHRAAFIRRRAARPQ